MRRIFKHAFMKTGDKIPDVLGKDENGMLLRRSDFAGKKLIVYFYPKDNTSGCTAQACSLRDAYDEIRRLGYDVVGVSVDSQVSHQKFIRKNGLPFHLVSDDAKELVLLFGVWGEKSMYGRKYMGTMRTTFVVDENGIITHVLDSKTVKTATHAQQLLALIAAG